MIITLRRSHVNYDNNFAEERTCHVLESGVIEVLVCVIERVSVVYREASVVNTEQDGST